MRTILAIAIGLGLWVTRGWALADQPAEAGRSLDDVLNEGPGNQGLVKEARDLMARYDAATEGAVRRVLSRQIAILVRRNLRAFTDAAQSGGPDRRLAIRALTLSVAPDTVELMVKMLEAPDLGVRLDAIKALGELRGVRSTEALLERLGATEKPIRLAVVKALGQLADRRSVEPLVGRLSAEPDAEARVALAEALGRMQAAEAKGVLTRIVNDKKAPSGLKAACEAALKSINTPDPEFKVAQTLRENPLPAIAEQMDTAEERLEYYWSGERTQRKQEQIVKALDDLIRMLEEEQQSQSQSQGQGQGQGQSSGRGSGAGSAGTGPRRDDGAAHTNAGGDQERARRRILGIQWGQLPPAVRAEVEQALRENLPERYRRLLESYTKALADGAERRR